MFSANITTIEITALWTNHSRFLSIYYNTSLVSVLNSTIASDFHIKRFFKIINNLLEVFICSWEIIVQMYARETSIIRSGAARGGGGNWAFAFPLEVW